MEFIFSKVLFLLLLLPLLSLSYFAITNANNHLRIIAKLLAAQLIATKTKLLYITYAITSQLLSAA